MTPPELSSLLAQLAEGCERTDPITAAAMVDEAHFDLAMENAAIAAAWLESFTAILRTCDRLPPVDVLMAS